MILSVLVIIVSVLLILVVLVQNSKGGGIQSQYGAATQIMGVKRGTEFIEKATWGLAIVLIALSILMAPKSSMTTDTTEDNGSIAKRKAASAVTMPSAPANVPSAPPAQPTGTQ
ncbi:MAG: preprotein translocase subunit SecG [Sphingobacteriaceae bacterium]|nr:preprotein translocase subunit SecG [Sphingobacteriaceae bacterium]